MKNSNLFNKLSCILPALLILCTVNISAQNYLSGYIYLGAYGSHYYYLSNCQTTWEEANTAANEMGGYLATLTDDEENGWVLYQIGNWQPGEVWIGLRGENGIYEWTNSETSGFENWAPSEPVYDDGAAFIDYSYDKWKTYPVNYWLSYIVEFPYQPNCNNNPNKAYVCHNGNTICVNTSAVQSHLDHGDLAGPCGPCNIYSMQALPDDEPVIAGQALQATSMVKSESNEDGHAFQEIHLLDEIHIFPNPASQEIHVELPGVTQEGTLRILSLAGQEVYNVPLDDQRTISIDLSAYAAGIYLIDVRSANGHFQQKMVKL
jgi:hypothetical protein